MKEYDKIRYSGDGRWRSPPEKFLFEIPYEMSKNVLSETEVHEYISQIRQKNEGLPDSKKTMIVLVSGVFDLFHTGHVLFLTLTSDITKEEVKERGFGRRVILARVAEDEYVKQYKGEDRPVNSEINRALVVANSRTVDKVFIDRSVVNPHDIKANSLKLKEINPDMVVFEMGDPNLDDKIAAANQAEVYFLIICTYEIESTTGTISRIRGPLHHS